MNIFNKNALVCKHNNLISATYKLNLGEQKLVIGISSLINPTDPDFKEYEITVEDYAKLMGIDLTTNKAVYTRLKRKSSILLSKRVTIHEPDGDLQTTWFASIKYFKDEGKMAFTFAPRLKPYYLQLKNYTKYRVSNIASLKSQYSIRIYELLKQYEKIKTRKLNLIDLKELLGLEKEQYPKFYDFKNRVLHVAQREINEKTDIKFTFEEIKTGRKVTEIKFFIEQKHEKKNQREMQNKEIVNTLENKEDLRFVYMLFSDKLSEVDCNKLYIAANYDLKKIKKAYELSLKQKNIKNLFAWLKDCIEKDYSIPVAVTNIEENKDTFNDFPQRMYDFQELEAKLLGIKK